jgi:hypothetical protein
MASGSSTATPVSIVGLATLPAGSLVAGTGATITPAVVVSAGTVSTHTLSAGALAQLAAVVAVATLPTVRVRVPSRGEAVTGSGVTPLASAVIGSVTSVATMG